jgi:site-specific DNA-methyltransferase (adenine-specific)
VRNQSPTEKPEEVSAVLIEQSSSKGQLVVDPFMGSGSVGAAALKLGRRFAGCDVKESAVELTLKRLRGSCDP